MTLELPTLLILEVAILVTDSDIDCKLSMKPDLGDYALGYVILSERRDQESKPG